MRNILRTIRNLFRRPRRRERFTLDREAARRAIRFYIVARNQYLFTYENCMEIRWMREMLQNNPDRFYNYLPDLRWDRDMMDNAQDALEEVIYNDAAPAWVYNELYERADAVARAIRARLCRTWWNVNDIDYRWADWVLGNDIENF